MYTILFPLFFATVDKGRGNDPVYDLIKKYIVSPSTNQETGWELLCEVGRMIEKDMMINEEEMFGGWGTMNDYKD